MIGYEETLWVCGYSVDEATKTDKIVIICDTCGTPNLRRKGSPLSHHCVECIHDNRQTPEEIVAHRKQCNKKYNATHREKIHARVKQYADKHKVEKAAYDKQYQREHPKETRTYATPAGSCTKLNNWFEGCRRHHVDADTIIHIPMEMHVTNAHNIQTGKGMDVINALSFNFLFHH